MQYDIYIYIRVVYKYSFNIDFLVLTYGTICINHNVILTDLGKSEKSLGQTFVALSRVNIILIISLSHFS